MENITASEIAGLGVGALLFCATIAARKVDAFISASQRISLGMCKKCGDMKVIACSRCKGAGMVKSGALNFSLVDDIFPALGEQKTNAQSISCSNCQGRGHIYCSDCSKRK
ncbi:chaperone [Thalictrum thalictroides]|uniref:Chaperone n=1 Tax=Thalictrum thalictroides TaxID=46969 RepID=A0A7J6WXV8_THATH|nr:chaperone [Thalictrum thalictroides]